MEFSDLLLPYDSEADLGRLCSVLDVFASGEARAVVIEGAAGCGKSELLESLAAHLSGSGALVLRATASPAESALPLGVMKQLVTSLSLPAGVRGELLEAIGEQGCAAPGRSPRTLSTRTLRMQRFCALLHRNTQERSLLIAVDDLQHIDIPSLQYLLYMAGRSRALRLMMVFTETVQASRRIPAYRMELLRNPKYRRVPVKRLNSLQVASALSEATRLVLDTATIERFYDISGGNPLLLRAALEDCAAAPDREGDALDPCVGGLPGSALTHAVTTCLDRSGLLAVAVAEGLAVLGEAFDSALLSRLCGLARFSTMQGLRVLRATGVVTDRGFRHPAVRAVVLESMSPERRRELHRVAARLRYLEGAEASEIAPHLASAARVDDPWGVGVLRDAAEEALVADRDQLAIDYLELAHAFCVEPRQRADIRIRTAVVRQRNDPSAAQLAGDELLGMLRAGQLTPAQSLATADLFSGCRRIDGVSAALAALREPGDGTVDGPAGRAAAVIEYCPPWPGVAPGTRNPAVEWEGRSVQRGEEGGTAAEELLRRTVLTDSTLATVGNAVRCLMHAGRPEAAGHWADVFVREAERRGADGWYATFAGIKAELALLTGDLPAAERYAQRGIDRLPKQKLGTLAGGLIAAQVLALTQMGEYEAGARWFEQPVPDDLLTSEHGLTYLRSRGCYHLVTNRLSSALNDFLAVGRRVRDWGIDQPQWIPWRGDAAEALLRLGETTEAEQLLSEQLALLPAGHDRVQGITLRMFSATVDVRRRPALLVRAVALLQSSGDRLQLAHALGELAESYRWLGEGGRAWAALSRAKELAEECGAGPLCDSLRSQGGPQGEEEPGGDCGDGVGGGDDDRVPRVVAEGVMGNQWDGGWRTRLSNSEKRVAALAAGGHTNRDISSQLHITVSTVEQHLTRIYRKLRIRGRDQLPVDLQFRDDPAKSTPCRTLP